MTQRTSLAVSLAAAATVLFLGIVFYSTAPARAAHPLTALRVFWLAFYGAGTIVMLAMLLHSKPRPQWLKIAALVYIFGAGLVSIYHFTQISIWIGAGMLAILATIAIWRTTQGRWLEWWAGW